MTDDPSTKKAPHRQAQEKVVPFPKPPAAKLPTDEALAQQFAARMVGGWRYVPERRRVMLWTGQVWVHDELNRFDYEARQLCVEIAEPMKGGNAAKMLSGRTYSVMSRMAKLDPMLTLAVDDWDLDEMALSCDGTLIDLEDSSERPTLATDYVTKSCAVKPGAIACPLWMEFLVLVTGGDTDLMEYLQRVCGYLLTGANTEQVLFFLWGPGGNGKTTFINTIAGIMGDYAVNSPMDMLAASQNDRHPEELARLMGARLVTATETAEGKRWDEMKLKQLTGGDVITAHFMRENSFDFRPVFKLVVSGNHKPELRGIDDAIKRRVKILPFVVKIPEDKRVRGYDELLKTEWPGILSWMIRGTGYWRDAGLSEPAAVLEATAEYFEAEDTIGMWLEECTEEVSGHFESSTDLFKSWADYAKRVGEWTGKQKGLIAALKKRPGLKWHRTNRARGFYGRRVKSETEQVLWSHNP